MRMKNIQMNDHLAPQSTKVKVGQPVSEGQDIAKVGNEIYIPSTSILSGVHF